MFKKKIRLKGQTLESLSIMPVQRIPSYCLLFQKLLSLTSDDHPDIEALTKANREISETAKHVEDAVRT